MSLYSINDPKHWLDRANEARALAEQMNDPEAKRTMLKMPTITSGSPKEPKKEQQDAGHSQSSCSIQDACSAEPTNSVTVHYAGGLNRPRSLIVASETAGVPGGEACAGALRLPGRLARCGTSRMRSTPWRCHSPWNCWQAMTVSNHVVWNRSSKIGVGWSASASVMTDRS